MHTSGMSFGTWLGVLIAMVSFASIIAFALAWLIVRNDHPKGRSDQW